MKCNWKKIKLIKALNIFLCHLKLEIALAIPALNEPKIKTIQQQKG